MVEIPTWLLILLAALTIRGIFIIFYGIREMLDRRSLRSFEKSFTHHNPKPTSNAPIKEQRR